ncbi:MAG: undecaprenyldiphospho-muramoylpentapeptide beta-N-acetylglucosaminyltransferase [Clostridia bacterium]|nr:undecaprenyldiphospho-muramoylpentapeptide beta-N-acetylglucosaminyltransferase [Clostridia bacterium]NLS84258.1 undecaprenyldiphospho-muramoylpentapeptide beta-N-acetylglucosaminyltransferase [Oscillospiraceae bacterium]
MKVLIAAGGTAGHINPALAIANEIMRNDPSSEIHFAGRKEGMEYALVTKEGYPFHHIEVNGIQRRISAENIVRNVKAVGHLITAMPRAAQIINEVKPDLVIGAGGYVSGPIVQTAAQRGIKTAIDEQNAFPGVTNKILAPRVDVVFAAMPDAVERLGVPDKTIVVGNPVRASMFTQNRVEVRKALGIPENTVVILSFGGSLGAQRINEVVASLAEWEISSNAKTRHYHATGSIEKSDFAALAAEKHIDGSDKFIISEYIDNMPEMLAAADLVIARAGALTLAEIAAVGRASILIPSPNVAENHQYHNAMQFEKAGAAKVIEEKDISGEKLIEIVKELLKTPEKLMMMGKCAMQLASPDSLKKIYKSLENLMNTPPKSK